MGSHARAVVVGLVVLGVLAACTPMPPPPMVPFHADPYGAPEGSTRILVVFGGAMLLPWGGAGIGAALRVEHQISFDDTVGVELGGGLGRETARRGALGTAPGARRRLLAARGYGRHVLGRDSGVVLTYGAGASWFDTGLVTATLDGGLAFGEDYRNVVDTVYGNLGFAAAIPVRAGAPFGDPAAPRTAVLELYPYLGAGMIAADGAGALSLDLTFAYAIRRHTVVGGLSAAAAATRD